MPVCTEYILKNGGLDTEEDYSYWSVGEMCNKNREGARSLSRCRICIHANKHNR